MSQPDDRGRGGFLESTLNDATITGTDDDPPSPTREPQGAAMPRGADEADEREERDHRTEGEDALG